MKARDLVFECCLLKDIRDFVETNHYSHNLNGVKITYCFKAIYEDKVVGAAVFGQLSTTAWKKFGKSELEVLELRRLVFLDEAVKNSESRFIGWMIRYIKNNNFDIKTIVSYADPNHGHEGVIYKASNFEYLGLSGKDKGYKDKITGKIYHSRALRTKYKGDYKPFVKKLRDKLEKGELEIIDLKGKHCYVFKIKRRRNSI